MELENKSQSRKNKVTNKDNCAAITENNIIKKLKKRKRGKVPSYIPEAQDC